MPDCSCKIKYHPGGDHNQQDDAHYHSYVEGERSLGGVEQRVDMEGLENSREYQEEEGNHTEIESL
jgi:hypothetical protein